MMIRNFVVSVVLLSTAFSFSAHAEKMMSLVTVSGGATLFDGFGHTIILVEDTENKAAPLIYDFGDVVMNVRVKKGEDLNSIMLDRFADLFESKIQAKGKKVETTYHSSKDEYNGVPEYLYIKYLQPEKSEFHREIRFNHLNLTSEQKEAFEKRLQDEIEKGSYIYQNFKNNCVTRIRDILFSEKFYGKPVFFDKTEDVSYQDLSKSSIDDAIALKCIKRDADKCTSSVSIVSPDLKPAQKEMAKNMLHMLGAPESGEFKNSQEMHDSLIKVDDNLHNDSALSLGMHMINGDAADRLPDAFHDYFFGPEMVRKPLTRWEATYTPKAFYNALIEAGQISAKSADEAMKTNDGSYPEWKKLQEEKKKK